MLTEKCENGKGKAQEKATDKNVGQNEQIGLWDSSFIGWLIGLLFPCLTTMASANAYLSLEKGNVSGPSPLRPTSKYVSMPPSTPFTCIRSRNSKSYRSMSRSRV